VEGFDDYGQINGVIDTLSRRGYSDSDIGKILGGNLLRVFELVWGG
jgi:membrane dipeptidase